MVLQTCFVLSQDAPDEMFLREDMEALTGLEIRLYHSLSKTNFFGGSTAVSFAKFPTSKAANKIEENRRNLMGKEHDATKMFQGK